MRTRADLRGYQRRAVRFIHRRRYGALLIDMGLGKTVIALSAILDLLIQRQITGVLLVAPIRVIQGVWRQEAKEWAHTRKLVFSLVHGNPQERLAALRKPAHIHMINPEGLKWLQKVLGRRPWPWDMLIVDESTEFTEPTAVRFKSLRKGLRHFKRRYVMTGTPTPRSLLQLWPQMFLADLGASLGQRYTDFKSNHFHKTGYKGYVLEPNDGAEELIIEAMSRRTLRLEAEDWIEVPRLVTTPVWVDLPPHARRLYNQMEEEMFLQFDTYTEDGNEESVAETEATLSIKCLAASTEVLTDSGWKRIDSFLPTDRLWDGVEWVNASGLVCNGYRETVQCWGIEATPDHLMLTTVGWRKAEDILGQPTSRFNRAIVRVPDCSSSERLDSTKAPAKELKSHVAMSMYLRGRADCCWSESKKFKKGREEVLRMPPRGDAARSLGLTWHVRAPRLGLLEKYEGEVPGPKRQKLAQLWRERTKSLQSVVGIVREFLGGYGADVRARTHVRPHQEQPRVLQGELSLGNYEGAVKQHKSERLYPDIERADDCKAGFRSIRYQLRDAISEAPSRVECRGRIVQAVYDIVDSGPRNRFVARGADGPVIVHNCRQIANGAIFTSNIETGERSWQPIHDAKIDALREIVAETHGAPMLIPYLFKHDVSRIRAAFPKSVEFDKRHVEKLLELWNRRRIEQLILHPANSKYGLNMQKGGNIITWFGGTFSRLHYDQTIGRLRRSGQTKPVMNYIILARDTVDEVVMDALGRHGDRHRRVSSAFKDYQERRRG